MKGGSQATTETYVPSGANNPSQNLSGFTTQESQYSNSQPEKKSRRSRRSKKIVMNKGRKTRSRSGSKHRKYKK